MSSLLFFERRELDIAQQDMLTMKKKYALLALVELGTNFDNGVLQIAEIAKRRSIPEQFLSNILIDLKRGGFVGSKKGKNGGYYLVSPPTDVSVANILSYLSENDEYICCNPDHNETCIYNLKEDQCPVYRAHLEIKNAAYKSLSNVSIDMLDTKASCLIRKKKI